MQWPLLWLAFQVQVAPSGCPIQIPGDSRATILKSVHRNQSNLRNPKSSNVSNESKIVQIFQFWVHTHRLHNWKFGTAVCVDVTQEMSTWICRLHQIATLKKRWRQWQGTLLTFKSTYWYVYVYIYIVCVYQIFIYRVRDKDIVSVDWLCTFSEIEQ